MAWGQVFFIFGWTIPLKLTGIDYNVLCWKVFALLWCVHWSLAGDDDRPIIFQNLLKCCLYRGTEHIVLESAVLSGVSGMQPGDSFTFLRQPTSSFEGWPIMSVTCLVAFCSLSVPRRWWKILPNMNTFKRVFPSLFSSVFTVFTHQTRRLSVSNPLL